MGELVDVVLSAPLANVLVIAGILFLLVAVLGNVPGKINPGKGGRIAAGTIGLLLIAVGLRMYLIVEKPGDNDESSVQPPIVNPPITATPPSPKKYPENNNEDARGGVQEPTNTNWQGCVITIVNSLAKLKSEPKQFSLTLRKLEAGEYAILDHKLVDFGGIEAESWFKIEVRGIKGWILDNNWSIHEKTRSCP